MSFNILLGIPEMRDLWEYLNDRVDNYDNELEDNSIKDDAILLNRLNQTFTYLSKEERGKLETHEIRYLTREYTKRRLKQGKSKKRIWESYLANRTSGAPRLFWAYGDERGNIIIVGEENHPNKEIGYSKVVLSDFPDEKDKSNYLDLEGNSKKSKKSSEDRKFSLYKKEIESKELGNLRRVSVNEYKVGAVYRGNGNSYLFIRVNPDQYLYVKLTNDDLKKLFKYKYDEDKYNKNPERLSRIKDIVAGHRRDLNIIVFDNGSESHSKVDYNTIVQKLKDKLEYQYKSVNESIEFILEVFGMIENFSEEYMRGFKDGYNSIKARTNREKG